jgi:aryl-alcohol dehydrogenase-like predicted oxidoreductase
MQYRVLGTTGLNVSVIGIGTWQFGGEWGKPFTQAEVDPMFDAAREVGITLIDTAECYGDHESERLIGAAIQRDRPNWVLATKFGHKFGGVFQRTEPRSPKDVLEQCESSLRALRTDYIDLYQYHSWGDDQFFADDVLATLHTLRDEGKIRHIGNSVSNNQNVKQVEASERMQIEAIQIVYNRLDREPETTTFPICQQQGLGVMARVPLASGYLSGKYKPGHVFAESDTRSRRKPEDRDRRLREVEVIAKSEVPPGVDIGNWALAWCLRHPAVHCVIPGCMNAEQVHRNAAAASLMEA